MTEASNSPDKKNNVRLELRLHPSTDEALSTIADALLLDKAAAMRLLVGFGLNCATQEAITAAEDRTGSVGISFRFNEVTKGDLSRLCEQTGMSRAQAVRKLVQWGIEHMYNYTLGDLVHKKEGAR